MFNHNIHEGQSSLQLYCPAKYWKHLFAAYTFGPTRKGMLFAFLVKPAMLWAPQFFGDML